MKVWTSIAIAFSQTFISVEASKFPEKYFCGEMSVLAKLVSSQLQSVNTPTEQIPNIFEFKPRYSQSPHASYPLQFDSGLKSGSIITAGEQLTRVEPAYDAEPILSLIFILDE